MIKLPDIENAVIAVDTETSGLDVEFDRLSVVSVGWFKKDGTVKGKSFAFDQGMQPNKTISFEKLPIQQHVLWGTPAQEQTVTNLGLSEWKELTQWISKQRIVGANLKYDMHMFAQGHREFQHGVDISENLIWDVTLATMLLEPRKPIGLKDTAARMFGTDAKDEETALDAWFKERKIPKKSPDPRKSRRYDFLPWDLINVYATKDVVLTLQVYQQQVAMIEEMGDVVLQRVFAREIELAKTLFRMERRGIGFDAKGCGTSTEALEEARRRLIRKLPFKPSLPAAKAFFFGPDGVAIPHREPTPSGQAKLDEEILTRMVDEDVEYAEEYQRLRNIESALQKWYVKWPKLTGADGRLRTVYNQTRDDDLNAGTVSGRLSASRIQLQAIPHDNQLPKGVAPLRSFFTPKKGHDLWELDLSQAEIRVAAWASKCKPMVETLAKGGADIHGATATLIWGVKPGDEDWEEKRQIAKRINFGINYGAGARALRVQIKRHTGLDVPLPQVEVWLNEYRHTYAPFVREAKRLQNQVEDRGYVVLRSGRVRWFEPYEPAYKAFNSVIQGGVAEVMKEWMIKIEKTYPDILLLQIHDSVVLEIPQRVAEETVAGVKQQGEKLFTRRFNRKNRPDLHIDFIVDAKKWSAKKVAA